MMLQRLSRSMGHQLRTRVNQVRNMEMPAQRNPGLGSKCNNWEEFKVHFPKLARQKEFHLDKLSKGVAVHQTMAYDKMLNRLIYGLCGVLFIYDIKMVKDIAYANW